MKNGIGDNLRQTKCGHELAAFSFAVSGAPMGLCSHIFYREAAQSEVVATEVRGGQTLYFAAQFGRAQLVGIALHFGCEAGVVELIQGYVLDGNNLTHFCLKKSKNGTEKDQEGLQQGVQV